MSAIATRLGYDPVVDPHQAGVGGANRTLVVDFAMEKGTAKVALRLVGTGAEVLAQKTLVSQTGACAELASAAALAAAVLLDPRAMFPVPPREPPAGQSLDSSSAGTWPWYEPPPSVPPPPPPPASPPSPWRWHGGLEALGCVGCAPAPNVGALLFVGVSKGRPGLDVGVRADLPASSQESMGRSASSSIVAGEVFPHGRFGPVRLGPVATAGALFGASGGESHVSVWAAVGARAVVDWTVARPLFLRLSVDGLVVVGRVSLRIEGAEVWSAPALAAAASVGAGAEF